MTRMARPGTADLHVHTTCSDGRPTPRQLAERLLRTHLTVVAITDHDTIAGALRVEEALAGRGPEIVVGGEVSSADGHVLALFVGPSPCTARGPRPWSMAWLPPLTR